MAVENLTGSPWELQLHGIEIKVSKSDLLGDTKYTEYADFADFMWLAVPENLVEDARTTKFSECGILVIKQDNSIEIIDKAVKLNAIRKKETLTTITLKLL